MNKKKRVLFVTEASYLNTGYSAYSKQVLDRLYDSGKYEVSELSIYGAENSAERENIRWKNYPNVPADPEELQRYNSSPTNQFGSWRFERACLDFRPDIILSIRDFWMDSFIYNSPFRRLFNWAWMPTVDASPQNEEWVHQFSSADYVLTYSDWADGVLRNQGGNTINLSGTASPSASKSYMPMDKSVCRSEFGLPDHIKIIGTVMRNQRRKLFPDLFKSFSEYIHENNIDDTFLYIHTSYPDSGWDLANLLHENRISSRVLMTYVCQKCGYVEASHFNDSRKVCPKCSSADSIPSGVGVRLPDEVLAKIYNMFDFYIQYANCEGYGLPQVEAAACGVPLACTNYSAMEDVIQKLGATPLELSAMYKELETGCNRAVPSIESAKQIFKDFFELSDEEKDLARVRTRQNFEKNYSWDKTAIQWMKIIDKCSYANWDAPSIIKDMVDLPDNNFDINNRQFLEQCARAYLIDESRINSHDMRCLQRDLNVGSYKPSADGFFYSEFSPSSSKKAEPINRAKVIDMFKKKLEISNTWESARTGRLPLKEESWLN